ncbi:MAG: hypothetical protein HW380_1585 [Magnetococcales bacterium]|nr:hypothetical protein [Magnetococcales bacterium]
MSLARKKVGIGLHCGHFGILATGFAYWKILAVFTSIMFDGSDG